MIHCGWWSCNPAKRTKSPICKHLTPDQRCPWPQLVKVVIMNKTIYSHTGLLYPRVMVTYQGNSKNATCNRVVLTPSTLSHPPSCHAFHPVTPQPVTPSILLRPPTCHTLHPVMHSIRSLTWLVSKDLSLQSQRHKVNQSVSIRRAVI